MRIHYLQHVPFEDLGSMEGYFLAHNHSISCTPLYKTAKFPLQRDFDLLIIMGGPMGVYEETTYPWLKKEKLFIEETIESDKPILGICLGAQLLADVLGARVYKNKFKEIGWFEIRKSPQIKGHFLDRVFPEVMEVFHWHGDTFELPSDVKLIASSKACENQGFVLDNRIVGLQFHLETTYQGAQKLTYNCKDELVDDSPFVQSPEKILESRDRFTKINKMMSLFMEEFLRTNQTN